MSDQAIIKKDYDKPLDRNVERLRLCLAGVSSVSGIQHRISELFVSLFLENFVDIPPRLEESLNWSNWTHHTYFAVRTTAKILGLVCTFETMGRLDAVVRSLDEYPGVILVAEWETVSSSIFGEHRELEKLWQGFRRMNTPMRSSLPIAPLIRCMISRRRSSSTGRIKNRSDQTLRVYL
jgi:hypothetical protein